MASVPIAGTLADALLDEVEAAALAASGFLEQLGHFRPAHAWSCYVAAEFGSEEGQLRCAGLEAEPWESHARNLSVAVRQLLDLVRGGGAGSVAAFGTVAFLFARVVGSLASDCHLVRTGVSCPRFEDALAEWGGNDLQVDRATFERVAGCVLVASVALGSVIVLLAALALRKACVRALRSVHNAHRPRRTAHTADCS